ncbi:MAG: sulfatase-like hydrolase/transferase [Candidatus Solibacter usitatus]|nr:sulfatase-like hydrolase/transferase [Candidatus Solibacter usitatus]
MLSRRTFLAAAAAQPAPAQPNILFLMCDQLNASVTSLYGGPVATPHLERLARRGVVFRNATCPTPFCSPTRASIVTGLYPHTHGIVHNVSRFDYPASPSPATEQGLSTSDVTTDSILHAAGYSTHQYGKWHLRGDSLPCYPDTYGEHREYAQEMAARFGEVRRRPEGEWMNWYGWNLPVTIDRRYAASFPAEDPLRKSPLRDFVLKMGRLELPPQEIFDVRVADKTIARLGSVRGPFSITCSFNWPHDPNVIHTPYYDAVDPSEIALPATLTTREGRFEKDLSRLMVAGAPETRLREFLRIYYASVRFIDDQVGRVLDALEKSGHESNTIVVFTSDHGDMAGGHGMAWKSTQAFYDEIARVPLVISWPGRIKPGKTDAEANLTDLAPTLLELTGQRVPSNMQGTSLASVLRGGSAARHVHRYSERIRANPGRLRAIKPGNPGDWMVRGEGWKYIVYADGEEFLYNLRRDPGELRNLAAERSARATIGQMRGNLHQWLRDTEHKS